MSAAHLHVLEISNPDFPPRGVPEILRGKHRLRILWDLQHGARHTERTRHEIHISIPQLGVGNPFQPNAARIRWQYDVQQH